MGLAGSCLTCLTSKSVPLVAQGISTCLLATVMCSDPWFPEPSPGQNHHRPSHSSPWKRFCGAMWGKRDKRSKTRTLILGEGLAKHLCTSQKNFVWCQQRGLQDTVSSDHLHMPADDSGHTNINSAVPPAGCSALLARRPTEQGSVFVQLPQGSQ